MKAKGFGGALIFDADGASQEGNERAPHGADVLLARVAGAVQAHAARGRPPGPGNEPQHPERLEPRRADGHAGGRAQETRLVGGRVSGPTNCRQAAAPKARGLTTATFRAGLSAQPGCPRHASRSGTWRKRRCIEAPAPFSAPVSTPLFEEFPAAPGEEDTARGGRAGPDRQARAGRHAALERARRRMADPPLRLHAQRPLPRLDVQRGLAGLRARPVRCRRFRRYWDAVVEPLIADAGPLAGKALKYLHTDSWEMEVANWTPTLRAEFQQRRGYDLLPWLPVIAGRIVNSRDESDRFLHDFRRRWATWPSTTTTGCSASGAHRHGLEIHPESGGPHAVPIDAQRCLGLRRRADERVLGVVVAAPHRRREPLLRQAARLRGAHLRPRLVAGRRLHHDRPALAGNALGQPEADLRPGAAARG